MATFSISITKENHSMPTLSNTLSDPCARVIVALLNVCINSFSKAKDATLEFDIQANNAWDVSCSNDETYENVQFKSNAASGILAMSHYQGVFPGPRDVEQQVDIGTLEDLQDFTTRLFTTHRSGLNKLVIKPSVEYEREKQRTIIRGLAFSDLVRAIFRYRRDNNHQKIDTCLTVIMETTHVTARISCYRETMRYAIFIEIGDEFITVEQVGKPAVACNTIQEALQKCHYLLFQ